MPDEVKENNANETGSSRKPSAGMWETVCAGFRDRIWTCDLFDAMILSEGRNTGIPVKQGSSDMLGKAMWISLALVIISGIGLMVGYSPTIGTSFPSVGFIQNEMPFGWWFRGVHKWGTDLFLILALLRLIRIASRRAYKGPGQLSWFASMGLIALACVAGLTGYLLVWNQPAIESGRLGGLGIPDGLILKFFPGGEILPGALRGVYAIHLVLGFIAMTLVVRHRSIARRLSPRWRDFSTYIPPAVTWTVIGFLTLMSLVFPPPLGGPSDGLIKPNPIFADWFFLPLYGFAKYMSSPVDPIALGIAVLVFGWIFLPFIDRSPWKGPRLAVNRLVWLAVISWLIFFVYGAGANFTRIGLTLLIVAVFVVVFVVILFEGIYLASLADMKSETGVKDS